MGKVKVNLTEQDFDFYVQFVVEHCEAILDAHHELGLSLADCICAAVRKAHGLRQFDPRQRTLELKEEKS